VKFKTNLKLWIWSKNSKGIRKHKKGESYLGWANFPCMAHFIGVGLTWSLTSTLGPHLSWASVGQERPSTCRLRDTPLLCGSLSSATPTHLLHCFGGLLTQAHLQRGMVGQPYQQLPQQTHVNPSLPMCQTRRAEGKGSSESGADLVGLRTWGVYTRHSDSPHSPTLSRLESYSLVTRRRVWERSSAGEASIRQCFASGVTGTKT
jgi:hypothetical protein